MSQWYQHVLVSLISFKRIPRLFPPLTTSVSETVITPNAHRRAHLKTSLAIRICGSHRLKSSHYRLI